MDLGMLHIVMLRPFCLRHSMIGSGEKESMGYPLFDFYNRSNTWYKEFEVEIWSGND